MSEEGRYPVRFPVHFPVHFLVRRKRPDREGSEDRWGEDCSLPPKTRGGDRAEANPEEAFARGEKAEMWMAEKEVVGPIA